MSTVKATDLRRICGPAPDQAEEIVVKAGAVDRPAADQLAPVGEERAVRAVLRGKDQMVRALVIGAEAAGPGGDPADPGLGKHFLQSLNLLGRTGQLPDLGEIGQEEDLAEGDLRFSVRQHTGQPPGAQKEDQCQDRQNSQNEDKRTPEFFHTVIPKPKR